MIDIELYQVEKTVFLLGVSDERLVAIPNLVASTIGVVSTAYVHPILRKQAAIFGTYWPVGGPL